MTDARRRPRMRHRLMASMLAALVLVLLPQWWSGRGASAWMDGEQVVQVQLRDGVVRHTLGEALTRTQFRTGSAVFDGEWLFGTYLMAGIGYAQMALEHPELREAHAPMVRDCIAHILTPEVQAFDRESWQEAPLEGLEGPNHHAAYLGYLNLLLGLHRHACGDETYAQLNDQITAKLVRHLRESRIRLLVTYPGEVYPVDNCFVLGSIGLHQRVTGERHGGILEVCLARFRQSYIDADTGLLIQAVSYIDGSAIDAPRGSGTALGLLSLHYADAGLAQELYDAMKRSLASTWCGFGAVREYPGGQRGRGDIDSGPIVFGYGLSATGFAIGGARRYGDTSYFRRLFATAHMCGAPLRVDARREYASGGPLGNAILFAMLTTPPAAVAEGAGP